MKKMKSRQEKKTLKAKNLQKQHIRYAILTERILENREKNLGGLGGEGNGST